MSNLILSIRSEELIPPLLVSNASEKHNPPIELEPYNTKGYRLMVIGESRSEFDSHILTIAATSYGISYHLVILWRPPVRACFE
jgi:hypothetical protein